MPYFKVTIRKPLGMFSGALRVRNPFEIADPFQAALRARYHVRVWDRVEAENEDGVRAFFAEAQKANNPQVAGFEIATIEPSAVHHREVAWNRT